MLQNQISRERLTETGTNSKQLHTSPKNERQIFDINHISIIVQFVLVLKEVNIENVRSALIVRSFVRSTNRHSFRARC